jgi:hypothetical protein
MMTMMPILEQKSIDNVAGAPEQPEKQTENGNQ